MSYTVIQKCRICGSGQLNSIMHLGEQALTGVFPKVEAEDVEVGPVEVVKCDEEQGGCGLVQLRQSFQPEQMYTHDYGYRSGLNASMMKHLAHRAREAQDLAQPQSGELILDIGSNDSTSLRNYPETLELVGMDPTGHKFGKYYPSHIRLISDFFSADRFVRELPGKRAKIITSIAMFYDLESPLGFMQDIHRILADDGIWVFEQSYLPLMLQANAYDTACHEHLSYYALKQIKWMTDRAGFKIIDVEVNDVNGGSFCVTVAKEGSPYPVCTQKIETLLADEERLGLSTLRPFQEFVARVEHNKRRLIAFFQQAADRGESVYGYGASTKGNVLLQYCGITREHMPAIAEVNADKFGAFTPGTKIPILSEAEVRANMPDYMLVLPWHFRDGIIRREEAYLARGGKLVFPLPELEIVAAQASGRKAA